MDINAQIKILETLLKLPDNRECSDCHSKTPRWASITFGTFVCLRCSGQHRQLQVHITKIKSVNLDKWKPEMVEMYKHVNNTIINSYWEAKLPANHNKPGQNASSSEVESFIRDKYINKRWVDTTMSSDIASMYWNDRKKFDKFIKKITSGGDTGAAEGAEEDSGEDKKKKKKSKKSKKSKKDSEDEDSEEKIVASKNLKAPMTSAQTLPAKKPTAPVVIDDLINLNAPANIQQTTNLIDAGFSDFQDANPIKSTDNDFNDFQDASSSTQVNQNGINLQNLMSLYNQNPQFNQMQQPGQLANQLAQSNKYQALDAFSTQYTQQQHFQQQQQQQQQPSMMFNPFAGAQPAAFQGQAQNKPPQSNNGFMGMMPQGGHGSGAMGQQTNMFAGMNMTINVNQYGQMPQNQAQPGQFNAFGNLGNNMMGQNPMINNAAFKPQVSQQPSMNNFGAQKMMQPPASNGQGNMYGGLVNLSNLGANSNGFNGNQGGFGNQGFPMGVGQSSNGMNSQQQKQKDAFSGLMKW